MLTPTDETVADIKSATTGFDLIFSNELEKAGQVFKTGDSALHLLGSGACAFLQAALSMEVRPPFPNSVIESLKHALPPCLQTGLISEASNLLEQAEAGAKRQLKNSKNGRQTSRFPAATEWELIYSDCTILLGLTYALRYVLSVLSLPFRRSEWILPSLSCLFDMLTQPAMTANPTMAIYSVCESLYDLIVAH